MCLKHPVLCSGSNAIKRKSGLVPANKRTRALQKWEGQCSVVQYSAGRKAPSAATPYESKIARIFSKSANQ